MDLSGAIGLLALSEKDASSQLRPGPRAWARCPREAELGRRPGSAGPEAHFSPRGPACRLSSPRISRFCGERILSGRGIPCLLNPQPAKGEGSRGQGCVALPSRDPGGCSAEGRRAGPDRFRPPVCSFVHSFIHPVIWNSRSSRFRPRSCDVLIGIFQVVNEENFRCYRRGA